MAEEDSDDNIESQINKMNIRVLVLENWREEMSVEIINRLLDQFTQKINKDMAIYLPKVNKMIVDYEKFLTKYVTKLKDNDMFEERLKEQTYALRV